MKKPVILLTFFALLLIFACKKRENKPDTSTQTMNSLPADFRTFYENFHVDSLYQLRHVAFPLQGLPSDADSLTIALDTFHYYPKDWLMQHSVDFSTGEFTQTINTISDKMVIEYILKSDGKFGIQRRFAKLSDGEWNLIYYVAPNHFSRAK
jgi:hypothetical protein